MRSHPAAASCSSSGVSGGRACAVKRGSREPSWDAAGTSIPGRFQLVGASASSQAASASAAGAATVSIMIRATAGVARNRMRRLNAGLLCAARWGWGPGFSGVRLRHPNRDTRDLDRKGPRFPITSVLWSPLKDFATRCCSPANVVDSGRGQRVIRRKPPCSTIRFVATSRSTPAAIAGAMWSPARS